MRSLGDTQGCGASGQYLAQLWVYSERKNFAEIVQRGYEMTRTNDRVSRWYQTRRRFSFPRVQRHPNSVPGAKRNKRLHFDRMPGH